ncbi:glycosyltransferase family 4 protein [Methanolobus bombayensis]|uniref:glycosyltransferase family 4 protein n=1 Tax=Methanolobus bombayensis TaxID=38023 RepID=UPI001AE2DB9E|nr:glycosyltransferase family 4 protein [Methanolobus bombayensis]MBP1910293.1 glycosyltransferase involved in cell wall biosynthesis [Methanolobus bombayensis]
MYSMDNKRCVLSICDISPSRMGSFEEFLIYITKKLKDSGFVHVIVFREGPILPVKQALINNGAIIEVIKPSRSNLVNFYTFYSLIKRRSPSIVHFHFYPAYSILNYLKFFFDIHIIHTDHMGGRKAKSPIKKILRRIYYYTNFVFFDVGLDKIVCVSDFVKSKYFKEYGIKSDKLHVIYNGINADKFYKKDDIDPIKKRYDLKDEYIISCVGMRRDKGPHYLLKAAPLILKEINNVKFILAGEGECQTQLDSMTEELKITDKVIFAGKVPDLSDIYSISSVVVIPSTFEEAFCFVAAEAMAAEAPVVAFDSGAIKDVLYDPNYIVSVDHKLLAAKVIECIKNGADTESARKHVMNNFSLESNVSKHLDVYKSLL